MYLHEFSNSDEVQFTILKTSVDVEEMSVLPSLTHIPSLDLQRQWYLYEQIRPHCKSNLAADLTCPKHTLLKPSSRKTVVKRTAVQPVTSQSGNVHVVHVILLDTLNVLFHQNNVYFHIHFALCCFVSTKQLLSLS